MQWFRFYSDVLNDPKVQSLDGETFKHWVNILCVASQNDGYLPEERNVSFLLRVTVETFHSVSRKLFDAGLLEVTNKPKCSWAVHGWDKRQYKSDTSTSRVKRFRERFKNVSVTPPDTDTEVLFTDVNNTKGEKKKNLARPDDVSQAVWDDFLKHRKAKRSPVSETVLARIRSECAKIGWTMDQALGEMCARGWQGFKAEWINQNLKGINNASTNSSGLTRAQRADIALGIIQDPRTDPGVVGSIALPSAPGIRQLPGVR